MQIELPLLDLEEDPGLMENEALLKEWIWTHHKSTILDALVLHTTTSTTATTSNPPCQLWSDVVQVQQRYLSPEGIQASYECFLKGITEATQSEVVYLGEAVYQENGQVDVEPQAVMKHGQTCLPEEVDTRCMASLFRRVYQTERPVMANVMRQAVPEQPQPSYNYLAIPLYNSAGDDVVGMLGVASAQRRYTDAQELDAYAALAGERGS